MEIRLSIRVGAWRHLTDKRNRWDRLRAWYYHGDGSKSVLNHVTRNFHGRFVAGGDWDIASKPFDLLPAAIQIFREGRRPQETDEYRRHLTRIEEGKLAWTRGCRNQQELDQYYADLVSAFEDIRANGYRTQVELGNDGGDEIRICIDRHGQLCVFGGGTHRLSIAKLLELEQIPVVLKRVHEEWVEEWKAQVGVTDSIEAIRRGIASLESAGDIASAAR